MQQELGLVPVSLPMARAMWVQGKEDADWPTAAATWPNFRRFVAEYQALSVLGLGEMLLARNSQNLGFVLLNQIDSTWLPEGIRAVECGTYLLPAVRAKGWNPVLKKALLMHASARFEADFAVFLIPQSNARAIRAMEKLREDLQLDKSPEVHPFSRYLRRKNWETGQNCLLYAAPLPVREPFSDNLD